MNKSFNWKSLTEKELDGVFKGISFKIPPRWHQAISVAFAVDNEDHRVIFLHGVGTGKTLCSLFTAQVWKCKKILVICPSSAFGAWERDIQKGTDYSYTFLVGTAKERLRELKKKHDVKIINYEGLKSIYCKLVKFGKKRRWKIQSTFSDNFDCIIMDEAHRCNNYKSLQTKICYTLSKKAEYVIGMTGTAVDKSMLELFNMYKVVDLGRSLGSSFFAYRQLYFSMAYFDWNLKKGSKNKILRRISNNTISFDREECMDLPELQEVEFPVTASKEYLDYQDRIIRSLSFTVAGVEVENSEDTPKANWLRELSGGFLYYNEDDKKDIYRLKKNPKLEALLDLIQDTQSKILVFYWYTEEKNLIEKMLKKNKIGSVSVYGGQDSIERKEDVKKFSNDSNIQVMIAQSRISEGYDASVANIAVFFLPLGSPRMRTQCVGRIYRSGQMRKCIVFDLVLKDSVDINIIKDRGKRYSLVNSVKKYMREYCQESGEI